MSSASAATRIQIASLARTLAIGQLYPSNWDKYNLRVSEQNLREAADKIKLIREEIDRLGAPELQAAE